MIVRVLLFGHYRDAAPESGEMTMDLPEGATVADVAVNLAGRDARLVDLLTRTRVAVAADFASPDTALRDGDEVAFLPPMSGG